MTRVPVPLCDGCWTSRTGGFEPPVRRREPPSEQCADCGEFTRSGITVMDDPALVQFPPAVYEEGAHERRAHGA